MSVKELNSADIYLTKSSSFIITQRIKKNTCFTKSVPFMGDDEDVICIERGKPIDSKIIKNFNTYGTYTSEAEIKIDSDDLESDLDSENQPVTDIEFKKKCNDAKLLSRKYARFFFIFECISIFFEAIAVIFPIVVTNFKLSFEEIIGIVVLFCLIFIFDHIGDWKRLREKYSHLYFLFNQLSTCKHENRVKEFRKCAISFGSSDLFIDSIILSED